MSDSVVSFGDVVEFSRRSKFTLEDFDTLQPGHLHWRVKGLWPAVGVCFVGGPSMSGKSFWTLDALAKVCRGEPVLGRKSIASGVVYIASEGAHGVRNRIAGLRSKIGVLESAFKFIGQAPDLGDAEDVEDLKATLLLAKTDLEAKGHGLGVIAVDTLSASIPGADENSAKDMSPVLAALQTMAAELGALVVVIAHTGKDETRGLRGWSGLLANADGLIMLDTPDGGVRVGSVVKVKDGESGDRFAFSLAVVEIGIDADGDPITTCTIEDADAPDRPKAGRKATISQLDADTLKTAFNRIFPDKAAAIHVPGANGAMGVHLPDLREEALKIGLGPPKPDYSGMDEKQHRAAHKAWLDHRNKSFDRAKKALLASGGYRVENEWIWHTGQNKGESA